MGSHRVALLVDTGRDTFADRGISLRSESEVTTVRTYLPSVHIEETEGMVRIVGANRIIELAVTDGPPTTVPPGFELVVNSGETGVSIKERRSGVSANAGCDADGEGCYPYDEDTGG